MSKTRASCFIRGSRDLETIKALALRPRAFICFSVSGTPGEKLALVLDILHLTLSHWFSCDVTAATVPKPFSNRRLKLYKLGIYIIKSSHNVIKTIDSTKVRDCSNSLRFWYHHNMGIFWYYHDIWIFIVTLNTMTYQNVKPLHI